MQLSFKKEQKKYWHDTIPILQHDHNATAHSFAFFIKWLTFLVLTFVVTQFGKILNGIFYLY